MSQVIESQIRKLLETELVPVLLDVVNESHNHSVPAGSESHFKLVCVSSKFEGKSRVDRQRMIYGLLSQILKEHVHALAMHTFTPEEWASTPNRPLLSPQCVHKK